MGKKLDGRRAKGLAIGILINIARLFAGGPESAESAPRQANLTERFIEVVAAPKETLPALFERKLRARQVGFLSGLRSSDPTRAGIGARQDAAATSRWREQAVRDQTKVVLDTFTDGLKEGFEAGLLGIEVGDSRKDSTHSGVRDLAGALVVGGCLAYFDGVHASGRMGPIGAAIDLRPAAAIEGSLRQGLDASGLARVELSWLGGPLTASAQVGATRGSLRAESYNLQYRLTF